MEEVSLDSLIDKNKPQQGQGKRNFNNNRRGGGNRGNNRGRNNGGGRFDRGRRNSYGGENFRKNSGGNFGRRQRSQSDQDFQQRNQPLFRVIIENLHYAVGEEELQKAFGRIGEYQRCKINWDDSGRSKETAYIDYMNAEDAERAIDEFNGTKFEGQILNVSLGEIPQKFQRVQRRRNFKNNNNNRRF